MIFGIFGIVLLGSVWIISMLLRQLTRRQVLVQAAYQVVYTEATQKKEILGQLADIAAGMVSPEIVHEAEKQRDEVVERLTEVKSEIAAVEAKQLIVESRLREIEELEREMENNSIEAQRELELLRDQEKTMREETERLRQRVNNSVEMLEQLLVELSSSQSAVEKLTSAKTELLNTESKIDYYSEGISQLNSQYIELKKGYDALDIEYAQLYERQNSVI